MKGRLSFRVKEMKKDNQWVYVTLEGEGAVTDEGVGKDAKASGADMTLRLKPLVGDKLTFGDKIYLNWSTDESTFKP